MILLFTLITTLTFSPESFAFGKKPVVPSEPSVDCTKYITRAEWQKWSDDIVASGGRVPDEKAYTNDSDGFKKYLAAVGASSARAAEMSVPANAAAAKKCGLANMLPNQCLWIRGASLALWADRLGILTGTKTTIRNWNRPTCYNTAVGGAGASDHLDARAMDLYFTSATTRRKSQLSLCSMWTAGRNLQVGLGGSMMHIGFNSPRGKRFWYYGSYTDGDNNTNCFAKGAAARALASDVDTDGDDH